MNTPAKVRCLSASQCSETRTALPAHSSRTGPLDRAHTATAHVHACSCIRSAAQTYALSTHASPAHLPATASARTRSGAHACPIETRTPNVRTRARVQVMRKALGIPAH
eukprot:5910313-Pleurochrysis_carterae.AAC.1